MNRLVWPLTLAVLLGAGAAVQCAAPSVEGLWVGVSRNGPDVRGTLRIVDRGGMLSAELAGFIVPVRAAGNALSFSLPDGAGDFRGLRQGDEIRGHWIQQRTVSSGARFATPITLRPAPPEEWRGEVAPLDDHMSYYLPVSRTTDGKLAAYLRNPERNLGRFIPVQRIEMEGQSVRLLGTRPGAEDESVLASGQIDPDAEALRFSIPIRGRSVDFEPDVRSSSFFYPRRHPGERYRYMPPIALDDGWPVSNLDSEGIDRAAIERLIQLLIDVPMDTLGAHQVHSLLIARHGKLVLEEYFHGHDRDTPHDLRSASKSWTAMLIGAAMQSGIPIHLETPVYETMLGANLPGDLDPRKRAMTLEHLLAMTAGFDCDDSGERPGDEDVFQQQDAEPDWYRFMLNVPMAWSSGEKIVYCSGKPNLAGGMLEAIAREPLPELFDRLIARPLSMRNYHLFLQPTGQAYGGGGHHFTSRDFLKYAQLMLNDGQWGGRQIFSREWARLSGAPLRVLSPRSGQTYGYLWNSLAYEHEGRRVHAFFAGGNGGQISMGIPDLDLVIVFTGGSYSDPVLFTAQRKYIPEAILPAVH